MSERDSTADGRTTQASAMLAHLWRRYRSGGDPRVRDRLVMTCAPMVDYIARRKLGDLPGHCELEDIVSCGLEALIRGIDCYDETCGATLEQFLWARVRVAMQGELRRGGSEPPASLGLRGAAEAGDDPALVSARDEARQRFRAAFRALPERDRRIAIMFYVENLKLREIGELLGVTESRVCQIHAQLRRDLRLRLADDAPLLAAVA